MTMSEKRNYYFFWNLVSVFKIMTKIANGYNYGKSKNKTDKMMKGHSYDLIFYYG